MEPPGPLIEIALEPESKADRARLDAAHSVLAAEDPTLAVTTDRETGQIVLGGTSEQQLDLAIRRLREAYDLAIVSGAPQAAYRETLTKRVEKAYTYKAQPSGTWQFARVEIIFEPDATATGTRFVSMVVGGAAPTDFVLGVEAGIASVARAGILAGFPVMGVKATLVDGAFHEVDSTPLAFEIAARGAFREALRDGNPTLLEPIMHVVVTVPEDYAGAVTSDMNARGRVLETSPHENAHVVSGLVSVANIFGYESTLRSMTQGRGTYEARFAGYQPVPPSGGGRPPPAVAAALRA